MSYKSKKLEETRQLYIPATTKCVHSDLELKVEDRYYINAPEHR